MERESRLLTISIAAYNVGSSLERTLRSLEAASDIMSRLDIIIVDDGSTDQTTAIADCFEAAHPDCVRVIHKENGGYGSTINASLAAAKGTYFKLLDGDDEFDAKGLSGLCSCIDGLAEQGPDIILSPFINVDRSENATEDISEELCDRHVSMQTEPVQIEKANLSDGLMMFEICVRTEVLRRSGVRLTENCYYTDNEYVMASELHAVDIMRYPFPIYRYSIGVSGQSMSIDGRRGHLNDKMRAACGVYSIYEGSRKNMNSSLNRQGRDGADISTGIEGSRKLITDKLLSTMTREVYVSAMIQQDPLKYREMLTEWDHEVSEKWPYIFYVTGSSKLVRTARAAGSETYMILCRRVLRSESRRLRDDSEGLKLPKGRLAATTAEYIAAACMIIQCRTVYMHLRYYGRIVNRSVWVIMIAALAFCIYLNLKKGNEGIDHADMNHGSNIQTFSHRSLYITAGIVVYTIVFLAVNPVNYLRVIRCAGAVLMMLLLTSSEEGKACGMRMLRRVRDFMVVIAGISLVLWLMVSVVHILPFTGTTYMDWSPTGEYARINSFFGIYFETQWTDFELVPARNCGIFVEGPMMGFACAAALMIELFINGQAAFGKGTGPEFRESTRAHISNIAVLSAAILSTLSIISYGALFLIFIVKLITAVISGITISRMGKAVTTVGTAVAFCLMAYFIIHKLSLPDGSTRINDFVVGFNAWLAHPFFGGGFESLEYLNRFMPAWRSFDTGFSNSPMEILAQGGIYLAVPYIYGFTVSLARSIRSRDLNRLAATVIFSYLFIFTVVPYQYITFFIIIMLACMRTRSIGKKIA